MEQPLSDELREWAERLDRAIPAHSRALADPGDDPLVAAAQQLAQGPDVALPEEAQARIEALLRARTRELFPGAVQPVQPATGFSVRSVLRWAAAACLILALLAVGVAQVSAGSLPGETLYPVKRAFEDVRLALISTNGEPALRASLAQRRLDEFSLLLARGRLDARVMEQAAAQMGHALDLLAAGHGDRETLLRRLTSLAQQQEVLLARAQQYAPPEQAARWESIAQENAALQARLLNGGTPPPAPEPPLTPTPSPTATFTPTLTRTPTPTLTPRPSATPLPATFTPPPTLTAAPTAAPAATLAPPGVTPRGPAQPAGLQAPSRTPPGHGPTPGLGSNPPGHGGEHPGQGNNGQPPGQNKPDKNQGKGGK